MEREEEEYAGEVPMEALVRDELVDDLDNGTVVVRSLPKGVAGTGSGPRVGDMDFGTNTERMPASRRVCRSLL